MCTAMHRVWSLCNVRGLGTAGTSAGAMLALYVASKGGETFKNAQNRLPEDPWARAPVYEGSVAVAWRVVRAMADEIFTPPWKLFLK